jgi:hypothetical protein
MFKVILGIDVSKLDLSIILLIDKQYFQAKIDNNPKGFKALVQWLKKHEAHNLFAWKLLADMKKNWQISYIKTTTM